MADPGAPRENEDVVEWLRRQGNLPDDSDDRQTLYGFEWPSLRALDKSDWKETFGLAGAAAHGLLHSGATATTQACDQCGGQFTDVENHKALHHQGHCSNCGESGHYPAHCPHARAAPDDSTPLKSIVRGLVTKQEELAGIVKRMAYLRVDRRAGTRTDTQYYNDEIAPRVGVLPLPAEVVVGGDANKFISAWKSGDFESQKAKKVSGKRGWDEARWQNYLHGPLEVLVASMGLEVVDGRSHFFLGGRAVDWLLYRLGDAPANGVAPLAVASVLEFKPPGTKLEVAAHLGKIWDYLTSLMRCQPFRAKATGGLTDGESVIIVQAFQVAVGDVQLRQSAKIPFTGGLACLANEILEEINCELPRFTRVDGTAATLRRVLGSGASSSVYAAYFGDTETNDGEDVAIKVFKEQQGYVTEKEWLAKVATVTGAVITGVQPDDTCLALAFSPVGEAYKFRAASFVSLVEHCAAVHSTVACVHRDIRPENLLQTHTGEPFLVDWAFACPADGESRQYRGTVAYAADRVLDCLALGDVNVQYAPCDDLESLAKVAICYVAVDVADRVADMSAVVRMKKLSVKEYAARSKAVWESVGASYWAPILEAAREGAAPLCKVLRLMVLV